MEHPFPVGPQVALYVASAAIVVLAAVVIPLLFPLRRQPERRFLWNRRQELPEKERTV